MKRGDVYFVNLSPAVGSELRDLHPCVVVQSNLVEHDLRPRTIVVPFTSKSPRKPLPYVVTIQPPEGGLTLPSYALCDQVTRLDKSRLVRYTGQLSIESMLRIDNGLKLVLDL